MASPFQNFVNKELPKRISTDDNPLTLPAGKVAVSTGIGLGTSFTDISTLVGADTNVVELFTAKNLPVNAQGEVVLPKAPIGDILYDTVIGHLNNNIIVEFTENTLTLTETESILTLPTVDFNNFKTELTSVTLSYLALK